MAAHYTAVLVVSETTTLPPTVTGYTDRRHTAPPPPEPKREAVEVAKIVVRAESLDALKEKLAAHAQLL